MAQVSGVVFVRQSIKTILIYKIQLANDIMISSEVCPAAFFLLFSKYLLLIFLISTAKACGGRLALIHIRNYKVCVLIPQDVAACSPLTHV